MVGRGQEVRPEVDKVALQARPVQVVRAAPRRVGLVVEDPVAGGRDAPGRHE